MLFAEFGELPIDQRSSLVVVFFILTRFYHEAVIVFFVLSGFLVGGRAIERIASGSFRHLDYMIDRFSRIMVPLVPALILTAAVGLIIGHAFNLLDFIGNLFSLQEIFVPPFGGNGPLWSLSYEVWFYVLVWACGVAILNRRLYLISFAVLIMVCGIFTKLSSVYLYCWLIGAFAYVCRPGRGFSLGYFIAGVVMALYGCIGTQIGGSYTMPSIQYYRIFLPSMDVSRLLLSSGTALLFQQLIMITPKRRLAVKLDSVGTTLAAFSYTLYLTHDPLIRLIEHFTNGRAPRINLRSITIYMFSLATCLVVARIMYWLFEKRTPEVRRAIRAWTSRWRQLPSLQTETGNVIK
jgi:peptidoglycan/LPS O-acetylase OafA/YrhL